MVADKLARASKSLILNEPFYGLFLVGLNKVMRKDIPTAGVSKHGIGIQLSINPDFFMALPDKHQIGLLKHELLHVSFGHMVLRDLYPNHKLFNIAADLEINQYIDDDYLPEGGLVLETFPELNLPKRAGTKVYYDLLEKSCDDGTCETLQNILNQMDGDSQYDHKTWEEFDDLSEADKKLVKKQVEHQLKETAEQTEKKRGNIPGELAGLIERLRYLEPASFDWKGYLKRFVGNSTITYTKKLRRKFNKRYSGSPGLKIKFKNNILVGVDTSGSVSNDELKEFMNELAHMHKTGHEITVAQCDTDIKSIEKFNPKKDWQVEGRGGTEFQPVIDLFNKKKGLYTALIYLTDGECYPPDDCPANTLWVHSSRCEINEELPGQKIQIN
jgi:predicted metal-dependent peptidase|tara:strand:- start:2003 stop:3160 length:1158 start_codon:yes stop_codon:yes gene_type:complete